MAKPKDFSSDVAHLPVADKAKRVIEGFLDAECTPSAWLDPERAEKLRKKILRDVRICAEEWSDTMGNASTSRLSIALRDCADDHYARGRRNISARLEILSEMLASIASPHRGSRFKRKLER